MKDNRIEHSIQCIQQKLELLQLCNENLECSQELLGELLNELAFSLESFQQQFEKLRINRDIAEWELHRYKKIFENSSEAYLISDRWGGIQEANRAAAEILKVPQMLLVGKLLSIFVTEAERANFRQAIIELLIHNKPLEKRELFLQPWDSDPFPVILSVFTVYDSLGRAMRLCWHIQNISYNQDIERLNQNQFHDSLTGLLDYTGFVKRFEHTLKLYRRHPKRLFALLFIDLDDFKSINNSFGHLGGNFALCETARRLTDCLREIDTISRFGGDEFVILLEDIDSLEDAKDCAGKIQRAIGQSFEFNGCAIELKASIGVIISDPSCQNSEKYLHNADLAMYDAKSKGGCCYRVFTS